MECCSGRLRISLVYASNCVFVWVCVCVGGGGGGGRLYMFFLLITNIVIKY